MTSEIKTEKRFEKDVRYEDYGGRKVTRVMPVRGLKDGKTFYLERKVQDGRKSRGVDSPGGGTKTM